jgi:hypothetical protein
LYVDEDAMDGDVVRGLRSRGIDVVSAADAGMIRRQDEDHLRLATAQGRALYSFNVGDFHEIHTAWTVSGRDHCGIVLTHSNNATRPENKFGGCCV